MAKHNKNKGLTGEQVIASRREHGSNVLTPPAREPLWKQFLHKFDDPLIKILLVALVLVLVVPLLPWQAVSAMMPHVINAVALNPIFVILMLGKNIKN